MSSFYNLFEHYYLNIQLVNLQSIYDVSPWSSSSVTWMPNTVDFKTEIHFQFSTDIINNRLSKSAKLAAFI